MKRITTLVCLVAGTAALVTSATTTGRRRSTELPSNSAQTAAVEKTSAELDAEIARLRARLHPTTEPQLPTRNLFRYQPSASRVVAAPALSEAPAAAPVVTPLAPPPAELIGIAEDHADAGSAATVTRTAILSLAGGLLLVKEGDSVTSQFRVTRITATSVDLADVSTSQTTTLTLKTSR